MLVDEFYGDVEANIIGSNYPLSDIFNEIIKNTSTSLFFFAALTIFIIGAGNKAPENTMTQFKRQWRELSDAHKEKISQSSSGKPKSMAHRQHISQSMKQYWRGVPHRPNDEPLSMDEYLGISERKPTGER